MAHIYTELLLLISILASQYGLGISDVCMDTCVAKVIGFQALALSGNVAKTCKAVPVITNCFKDAKSSCPDDDKKKIDQFLTKISAQYDPICGNAGGSGGAGGAGGSGGNGAGAANACNFLSCVTGSNDLCKMYSCMMKAKKKCNNDKIFDAFLNSGGDTYKQAIKKCANGSGTMTPSLVFVVASILLAISSRF